MSTDPLDGWLAALEARHLADLTPSEVTRALRALSSCYVERREKLAAGGALDGAGKRAAFALFYGPQHFLLTRAIVRSLDAASGCRRVLDLGCGTGAAGAALALESAAAIEGVDRNPWAVREAQWTYRTLGLDGRAAVGNLAATPIRASAGVTVLAAWTVNELADAARAPLCGRLLDAHRRGAGVLVVEPIGRQVNQWWSGWATAFAGAGGREDDWRLTQPLPARQRQLAKGAGLGVGELTARSLYLPGRAALGPQ